jgi:hypothetical protein
LASIQREDVVALIEAIVDRQHPNGKKGSPGTARLALNHLKRIFNWAIERGKYGLKTLPCDRISSARLIGPTGWSNLSY